MELFFLCTIIMAAVSFISISLSQPPAQFSINITDTTHPTKVIIENVHFCEGAYSELPNRMEMVA